MPERYGTVLCSPTEPPLVANPNGQDGLAHTRWSDENQAVAVVDKAEVQQGAYLTLGDARLVSVILGDGVVELAHGVTPWPVNWSARA